MNCIISSMIHSHLTVIHDFESNFVEAKNIKQNKSKWLGILTKLVLLHQENDSAYNVFEMGNGCQIRGIKKVID